LVTSLATMLPITSLRYIIGNIQIYAVTQVQDYCCR